MLQKRSRRGARGRGAVVNGQSDMDAELNQGGPEQPVRVTDLLRNAGGS